MHLPARSRARGWGRRTRGSVLAALMMVAASACSSGHHGSSTSATPPCTATVGTEQHGLELDQARNATTIASVAKRMGLPNHAITVALAAAYQESRLQNLAGGDRDSLGLFQQRPSQGWGTKDQIMDPRYAAQAFYSALQRISGWTTMPVTVAAQRVQRSAAPSAYAQWEPEARVLAQVLSGEVAAGFTCRAGGAAQPPSSAGVSQALAADLSSVTPGAAVTPDRGWTAASFLIARADTLGLRTVTYGGHTWTAATGTWATTPPVDARLRVG